MSNISSIEAGLIGCIQHTLNVAVGKLAEKGTLGNKERTHDCLQALANLGMDIGYQVCPWHKTMKDEWLYDLIWYTEEEC